MSDALIALEDASKQETNRALLICSGAKNEAICTIASAIFGFDVLIPVLAEFVAMGAVRQATWTRLESPTRLESQRYFKHFEVEPDTDTVAHHEKLRDKT